jgi:hypothetical protein
MAVAIYSKSLKPLQGNLPVHNMPELGRADWETEIYNAYDFFVRPAYFIYALPVLPILFTLLFTQKKKLRIVLLGAVASGAAWVLFWEVFFRVQSKIIVLQYFLEGNYTSKSLFFDGLESIVFTPLLVVVTIVVCLLLSRIGKRPSLEKI